jgi:ATP-dependent helicase/nuclease subunit B
VDLQRAGDGRAYCVILDYKSGLKKPEEILLENGIQQQLTGYLLALIHIPETKNVLGVSEIIPAGCFLIPLRPAFTKSVTRKDLLKADEALQMAYTHKGIFDWQRRSDLDSAVSKPSGQFEYKIKKDGDPYKSPFSGLESDRFLSILYQTHDKMRHIGNEIYSGKISITPYRKGSATACDTCRFPAICRFDPWIQPFNVLKSSAKKAGQPQS